jgi:serine/threonine protein kinase/DNA-binding beta-propeller fold protein YncE
VSDEIPAAPGGFAAGSQIAGYQLEEQIGRGGMAVVFRAHDPRLGRRVALKILAPELARDEAFRQRFIRESRAAAAVDHPHIIPVFEAGEAEGVLFIAMRYVVGRDVRTLLDELGQLPAARVAGIVSQVASALDAAHSFGLVHRDVKPANMLLDAASGSGRPDHIYLSDFGLSKHSLSSSGLTGTGQFLGTLDYVAPEQIEGKAVDGAADQYALAGAAFEMLGGQPPFRRDQGLAVLWAQISETPPPITSLRPDLPPAVDAVMARALAKSPADRYPTCLDFARALREACGLRPEESDPRGWQSPGPGAAGTGGADWTSQPRQPTELARPSNPPTGGGDGPPTAAPGGTQSPSGWAPPQPAGAGAGATAGPYGQGPAGYPDPAGQAPPGIPGPATEAVRLPGHASATRGGLTEPEPHGNYGMPDAYGPPVTAGGSQSWWRSRAAVALAAVLAVIVVAGGGYLLLGGGGGNANNNSGGSGGGGNKGGGSHPATVLTAPGCRSVSAPGKVQSHVKVPVASVQLGGEPFAVTKTPDGKYLFVTTGDALSVLKIGSSLAPTLVHNIPMPGANKGTAFTKDGHDLIVATGGGAKLYSVAAAEQGTAQLVGTLSTKGGRGAVQAAVSPDGNFLFVTLQSSGGMAVFNLQKAFTSGFNSSSDLVGIVPTGVQPVGVTISPDGKTMYVASIAKVKTQLATQGVLSIIDEHKAETDPEHAVINTLAAGCGDVRAITSDDGTEVWVTARESDMLLGYDAGKLRTDPKNALNAKVPVGAGPIGVTYAKNKSRLVVACSNLMTNPNGHSRLYVVNPQAALEGDPAVTGIIPAGTQPRQFTTKGNTLLVTNTGAGQLQALNMLDLP